MCNSNNKENGIPLLKSKWEVAQEQQIKKKDITKVLAAQKEERARIKQEIQGNLNQVLIAALLYIELAKTDDDSREMCLQRSSAFISTVIEALTNISQTLSDRDLDMRLVDS